VCVHCNKTRKYEQAPATLIVSSRRSSAVHFISGTFKLRTGNIKNDSSG
jgi:hypothetical protein